MDSIGLDPPRRALIFLLSGLGDTLMFTPALKLMRAAWPKARLVAVTMRESEHAALEHNPDLDEVRQWPFLREDWISTLRFLGRLRKERFDLGLLPCPSNRVHYNVIAFLAGAARRAAFRYARQSRSNLDFLNTILIPHRDHAHNVEHNIVLAETLTGVSRRDVPSWNGQISLPTTTQDVEAAECFLKSTSWGEEDCVGLHVSSSRAKQMHRKCWPKESFLKLIETLRQKRARARFILFCGEEDAFESKWLSERAGEAVCVATRLPIRTVAEILRRLRLFVSNDSGLLHVASSVRVPTVAIFGPTNPKRTGPWMGVSEVVRTGIPCSPCFYHTSRDLTCPAGIDFACLKDLSVEHVAQAMEKYLSGVPQLG